MSKNLLMHCTVITICRLCLVVDVLRSCIHDVGWAWHENKHEQGETTIEHPGQDQLLASYYGSRSTSIVHGLVRPLVQGVLEYS